MTHSKVAVIGAGGHARVVASTLLAAGHHVSGFYDDDAETWGRYIFDIPVVGPIKELKADDCSHAILGIGSNHIRKRLAEELDLNWITVVHPFAWVHPEAIIGPGTVVCAGAIVQPYAHIGAHVILNTKASVEHDCYVGDYVHMAMSHLAGGASADEGAFIALGGIVLPGINVGAWSTLGAGALATQDVPPDSVVVGPPSRITRAMK